MITVFHIGLIMEAPPELTASSITKSNSTTNNSETQHRPSPARAVPGCGSTSEYVELQDDNTYSYLDTPVYSGLTNSYSEHRSATASDSVKPLSADEIQRLHELLRRWDTNNNKSFDNDSKTWSSGSQSTSADSNYPEFGQSTHAWAV